MLRRQTSFSSFTPEKRVEDNHGWVVRKLVNTNPGLKVNFYCIKIFFTAYLLFSLRLLLGLPWKIPSPALKSLSVLY